MNHNSFTVRVLLLALVLSLPFGAEAQDPSQVAHIAHVGKDVVVTAPGARPLYLALTAVSEEFGWIVDYEDPVYSAEETRDATVPEWRRAHPHEHGSIVPSGENFAANLGQVDRNHPHVTEVVGNLVAQFNRSANPGVFRVIHTAAGRLVVAGRSRTQKGSDPAGVLDQSIIPGAERQVVDDALKSLTVQCSAACGVSIALGQIPGNAVGQSAVGGYKGSISCRDQLGRILSALPYALTYALLYDPGGRTYYLSIVPAH
jgi:hypothetical protein